MKGVCLVSADQSSEETEGLIWKSTEASGILASEREDLKKDNCHKQSEGRPHWRQIGEVSGKKSVYCAFCSALIRENIMTKRALEKGCVSSLHRASSKCEMSRKDLGQLSSVEDNSTIDKRIYGICRMRKSWFWKKYHLFQFFTLKRRK